MFIAVIEQILLIIVGKPGTWKGLSLQLIYNAMRESSKDKIFREFSQIILTYFHWAESTFPVYIEKLIEVEENKINYYKDKERYKGKLSISIILFDELIVLHSILEYSGCKEGVSLIGINNKSLDSAK